VTLEATVPALTGTDGCTAVVNSLLRSDGGPMWWRKEQLDMLLPDAGSSRAWRVVMCPCGTEKVVLEWA
jgi:hypothetical protein